MYLILVMNPQSKDLLLDIFSILNGKIETRKKIHKIIYILMANGAPNLFNYTFGLYGPYSSDLDALLYTLIENGTIKREETNEGITIYSVEKLNLKPKILGKKHAKLVKLLGSMAPWELEIISTILYLDPNADDKECIEIVNNVKPEKFSPQTIKATWVAYKKIINELQ